jgi:hypothetical protein
MAPWELHSTFVMGKGRRTTKEQSDHAHQVIFADENSSTCSSINVPNINQTCDGGNTNLLKGLQAAHGLNCLQDGCRRRRSASDVQPARRASAVQ